MRKEAGRDLRSWDAGSGPSGGLGVPIEYKGLDLADRD